MKLSRFWKRKNTKEVRFFRGLVYMLPAVLLGAILIAFTFKSCSSLGEDSRNAVLEPLVKEGTGFIGKSDLLLAQLSAVEDSSVKVNSVELLNKRYPALIFELPYDDNVGGNVQDVRLVGIRPEYIKDPKLLQFYHNSNLPGLLKKQKENLSEKYFGLSFNLVDKQCILKEVKVISSMFKVALEKNPWEGTITGAENSLFDVDDNIFLVYGDAVLPVARTAGFNPERIRLDLQSGRFRDKNGREIDLYAYWKSAFYKTRKSLRLDIFPNSDRKGVTLGWMDIIYSGDGKVGFSANKGIMCNVYIPGQDPVRIHPSEFADNRTKVVDFCDGMKLVVHRTDTKAKIAEMSLVAKNPGLILSTMVQSNAGKTRYWTGKNNADVFTRQLMRGLSRNLSNTVDADQTVRLSIDPLLSKEFEKELEEYLGQLMNNYRFVNRKNDSWEISMTVMDVKTGNIIASPSVSAPVKMDEDLLLTVKNSALVRRPVGSAFKPLLALASVLTNPSLTDLKLGGKAVLTDPEHGNFLGYRTKAWATSHWSSERCASMDLTKFIGCSDDLYPVVMTALCLSGYPENHDLSRVNRLQLGGTSYFTKPYLSGDEINLGNPDLKLPDYELIKMLATLYSVHSFNNTTDSLAMQTSRYLWDNLKKDKDDPGFGLDDVSPDATNMRYDIFDLPGMTLHNRLKTWVLGQGGNDWSCLKLAEAWARMVTKKQVKASFVVAEDDVKAPDLVTMIAEDKASRQSVLGEDQLDEAWDEFLAAFRKAQSYDGSGATLSPMNTKVNAMNTSLGLSAQDRLVLLSKTGTPDQYAKIEYLDLSGKTKWYDVGQYAFALMPQSSFDAVKERKDASGIVCVIRVTRYYTGKDAGNGLWATDARNFFSTSTGRLEKFYHMTKKYY